MKKYVTKPGKRKAWKEMMEHDKAQAKRTVPGRSTTQLSLAWSDAAQNLDKYKDGPLRRYLEQQYPEDKRSKTPHKRKK